MQMGESIDQRVVCTRFSADFYPPGPQEKLGIALQSLHELPINALRFKPENGTCGWFIWCGEHGTTDDNFYQPLCVSHLSDHLPQLMPYLGLAPGWRVLLAPGYEDVWFDDKLLAP